MKGHRIDQTILLVTHGDIGKMIQAAHHAWDWEQGVKAKHFGNADVIILEQK